MYRVRAAKESDLTFVNSVLRHVDKNHQKIGIRDVWVACDEQAPDVLFGFLWAPGRRSVGYIFTKEAFRQFGIARQLVDHVFLGDVAKAITSMPMSRKTAVALKHLKIAPATALSWEALLH